MIFEWLSTVFGRRRVLHLRKARATKSHSYTYCGLRLPKGEMRDSLTDGANCKRCLDLEFLQMVEDRLTDETLQKRNISPRKLCKKESND